MAKSIGESNGAGVTYPTRIVTHENKSINRNNTVSVGKGQIEKPLRVVTKGERKTGRV